MIQRRVIHTMGTVFSICVDDSKEVNPELWSRIESFLMAVDSDLSPYREESLVSRINRGEAVSIFPPYITSILDQCSALHRRTKGLFSVYYNGQFDPSGYVKGWAIEQVSQLLRSNKFDMHLVNGGGDIQTGSGFWGVGISNPFDPRESIRTLEGTNFAVATSGSGERGKHIVNPFTGEPPSFYESITLVGKQISQLDPLATVAFLLSPTECRTFLNSTPTVSMGLAITHDGTVIQLK